MLTRYVVWALVALGLFCELPLQLAGMCVKGHQAEAVSAVTHESPWLCHMKLLSLKLRRGLYATEQYRKSDFIPLSEGEKDMDIDHRKFRTYQYLNHWWSILLANRARYSRMLIERP